MAHDTSASWERATTARPLLRLDNCNINELLWSSDADCDAPTTTRHADTATRHIITGGAVESPV
jgi:hypothetical protein